MKEKTVLYYRYLFRQSLISLIASMVIAITISLVMFLVQDVRPMKITNGKEEFDMLFLIPIIIWIYPIYAVSFNLFFLTQFLKSKKSLSNLELYSSITNGEVRETLVKSSVRIRVVIPKKDQANEFSNVINPVIEKHKKLISIKKGEY